jgi:hypothetical protein
VGELRYPWLRRDLSLALRSLAERESPRNADPSRYVITEAINRLDDLVPERVEEGLGVILRDEAEAQAIDKLRRHIDAVLGAASTSATDADLRSADGWADVRSAAVDALLLLER